MYVGWRRKYGRLLIWAWIAAFLSGPRQYDVAGLFIRKEAHAQHYEKSAEEVSIIKGYLSKSVFFRALGDEELKEVIDAMKPLKLAPGKTLIRLGAQGRSMYLVGAGSLDCSLRVDGKMAVVAQRRVGDVVGELAIIYNRRRAATVVSSEESLVWELDGKVFWQVVRKHPKQWVKVIEEMFSFFDSDGSGAISAEEVRAAMGALGADLTRKELDDLMRKFDTDHSGEIDLDEFRRMMDRTRETVEDKLFFALMHQNKMEGLQKKVPKIFAFFDSDGDGKITSHEVRRAVRQLGTRLSDDEVEELMTHYDTDKDGVLDKKEFEQMITKVCEAA